MLTRMVGFVTTTAPERARAFYGDTLGFRFIEDDGFALSFDAQRHAAARRQGAGFTPSQATVLGWEVDDIVGAVPRARRRAASSSNSSTCRSWSRTRSASGPRPTATASPGSRIRTATRFQSHATNPDRERRRSPARADRAARVDCRRPPRPRRAAGRGARSAAARHRLRLQPGSLRAPPPVEGRDARAQGVAGAAARPAQGERRPSARCTASRW